MLDGRGGPKGWVLIFLFGKGRVARRVRPGGGAEGRSQTWGDGRAGRGVIRSLERAVAHGRTVVVWGSDDQGGRR